MNGGLSFTFQVNQLYSLSFYANRSEAQGLGIYLFIRGA